MVKVTHDGKRYRITGHRGEAGLRDLLKWQMSGQRARWPKSVPNQKHLPPPRRVAGEELKLTWIGHSTALIQTAGLNILTDPFLSERASPLRFAGPKRVRPPGLTARALPPVDIILLSHNHYDHMDLAALAELAQHHSPHVVTPAGNARWIRSAGPSFRIDELGWGEATTVGGARIHLTPALHWSKRGFFDANAALWGAFAVEISSGLIYFAGDTGYGDGHTFRDLKARFGAPRLSLLPIGAYEPRWFMHPQHMDPDEAVLAHVALGSRTSLAIHHGTIQLTDEAIDAPAAALREALARYSVDPARFIVADVGETLNVG